MPRYDLLAIDLDGTLLDPRSMVSDANVAALARARAAGIRTVVCTGRGLVECVGTLDRIGQKDPVVVAGGAIIADPTTRKTIHRFSLSPDYVRKAVGTLLDMHHAALVLKDPLAAGYDYLVVRGEKKLALDPVTEWWFDTMDVKVQTVTDLSEDEHPEHTVRVGACGLSGALAEMTRELKAHFGETVIIHHFPAVVAPEHASRAPNGQTLQILEVFDRQATKWSALSRLAREWNIPPTRIAAVGDEINDLVLLENVALSIAMGNAVPRVKAIAKQHTRSNAEHGVAHAVDQILAGAW